MSKMSKYNGFRSPIDGLPSETWNIQVHHERLVQEWHAVFMRNHVFICAWNHDDGPRPDQDVVLRSGDAVGQHLIYHGVDPGVVNRVFYPQQYSHLIGRITEPEKLKVEQRPADPAKRSVADLCALYEDAIYHWVIATYKFEEQGKICVDHERKFGLLYTQIMLAGGSEKLARRAIQRAQKRAEKK